MYKKAAMPQCARAPLCRQSMRGAGTITAASLGEGNHGDGGR
jgi:hypothetical protein